MIVTHKSVGSYERRLNRLQLRGEATAILNRMMDELYENADYFNLKAIEIIVEGSVPRNVKSGQIKESS